MIEAERELDDALERIANDIERRSTQLEFPAAAMTALTDQLRRIQSARQNGDLETARTLAASAQPALALYRPTNATSRSKALWVELLATLAPAPEPTP